MKGPIHMVFKDLGVSFVVGPAFSDLNTLYHAASLAFVKPYILSVQLGRLSEERSQELLASTYAEGVVFESEPPMSPTDVRAWLLAHPEEFTIIREYAEHRANFEDEENGEHQSVGEATGEGGR